MFSRELYNTLIGKRYAFALFWKTVVYSCGRITCYTVAIQYWIFSAYGGCKTSLHVYFTILQIVLSGH